MPGVPDEVLTPWSTWDDQSKYDATARKLVGLFHDNFDKYHEDSSEDILAAGPIQLEDDLS